MNEILRNEVEFYKRGIYAPAFLWNYIISALIWLNIPIWGIVPHFGAVRARNFSSF